MKEWIHSSLQRWVYCAITQCATLPLFSLFSHTLSQLFISLAHIHDAIPKGTDISRNLFSPYMLSFSLFPVSLCQPASKMNSRWTTEEQLLAVQGGLNQQDHPLSLLHTESSCASNSPLPPMFTSRSQVFILPFSALSWFMCHWYRRHWLRKWLRHLRESREKDSDAL